MSRVETNSNVKFQELDDDVLSIPDSFDNELFTQTSKSADNTELVSVILEGLESNCDRSSQDLRAEKGSGGEPKSVAVNTSAQKTHSFQSNQNLSESGVQTSQRSPKTVLQSVSTQCSVTKTDRSVQTIKEVVTSTVTTDADCCQSNNCFHKSIESIPCTSLNTFLKTLVEMKVSPTEVNQIANKTDPSVTLPLDNNESRAVEQKEEQAVIVPKERVDSIVSVEDKSVADAIPPVVEPLRVKKPTKTQPTRRQSTENKKASKRVSFQLKNKSKKRKPFKKLHSQEADPQEILVSKNVITIDSFVGTSQSTLEETVDKTKSKIKGPKTRQKTKTNSAFKRVCAEPMNKTKKPKVYVSSDGEAEEVLETEKLKTDNTLVLKYKNKSNQKTLHNKPQDSKTIEMPSVTDSTADEIIIVGKQNKNTIQTTRRTLTAKQNKSREQNIGQLSEESNMENVDHFSDDQKKNSIYTKQNNKNITEEDTPIVAKYKSKPKSKKSVLPTDGESNNEVLKRPASPSPSIVIPDTSSSCSSSSHSRSLSNEPQKQVILVSGLDEKQKKKVEKVCRDLNAEAVNDWTDKVTHLVIALDEDRPKEEMICSRNGKYIKALLNNNWIVTYEWIVDSSLSNQWVDETNYEIKGDNHSAGSGLPNKSRSSGEKLFAKRMFKFDDKIGDILDKFKEFVRIGGGIVVDSVKEFNKMKSKIGTEKLIIVIENGQTLPKAKKDGIKYICKKAFMDSICNFNPI